MIRVRRAMIQDLPSLVDINKSDVTEWHHFDRHGRGAKATYEELTGCRTIPVDQLINWGSEGGETINLLEGVEWIKRKFH